MNAENYPAWDIRAYDYTLPPDRIAQHPVTPRDASRLLCYQRDTNSIHHRRFYDVPSLLRSDDTLVFNSCRVFPARLFATRVDTGTSIEILLLENNTDGSWNAMVRPGRSCKPSVQLQVHDTVITVKDVLPDGHRILSFPFSAAEVYALCEKHGTIPLPPYISRPNGTTDEDAHRYQTIYAKDGHAVAAPTAGLHFTPELFTALAAHGCKCVYLTLNVGPGTFQPVKTEDIRAHEMHREKCELSIETAEKLNTARERGTRIIAVGTTVVRTLESCINDDGIFVPQMQETDIFIYPPRTLKSIDAMITNFHLPRSTLLMLIASWVGDAWRDIYQVALENDYRFYSYGDAMFLE